MECEAFAQLVHEGSPVRLLSAFIAHPFLYDKLPYDPRDLVPIVRVSSTLVGVGVPASLNVGRISHGVPDIGGRVG